MSLKFRILSSGSCGNASIIKTDKVSVMIDFGCSLSYIRQNVSDLNIDLENIDAVLITHAHSDHLSASGFNFLCQNNIPVYFHPEVWDDVCKKFGDKADNCNAQIYDDKFSISDIFVRPFTVYHKDFSISRTLGFTLANEVKGRTYKIGYITDTGKITEGIKKVLADSNILIIESNYNLEMLENSFRPQENKRWVSGEFGHLANEDAAKAICEIKEISTVKDSLKYVFLAHISRHHNTQELALRTAQNFLSKQNILDINLFAAQRQKRSKTIMIGGNK
jgi:phosphoribosyl 1,2-cyclic phosphodiesterase